MKFRYVVFTIVMMVLCAPAIFAQKYTMPGKGLPVPCTGCGGTNEGKPTQPFTDPLVRHLGRYVDSSSTISYQNIYIRTVRARAIQVNPDTNRLYIQLGEAVGGYKLSDFFTNAQANDSVLAPMVTAKSLPTNGSGSRPWEKVTMVDSLFYTESPNSGWTWTLVDSQRHLNDFDSDDRGYVYVATVYYGWGIAREVTGGLHMGFVAQFAPTSTSMKNDRILSVKTGGKYYAIISAAAKSGAARLIMDVTNPASAKRVGLFEGTKDGIIAWSKYTQGERVATLNTDGHIRVFANSDFVTGAAPLADIAPPSGRTFKDLSFDSSGSLWIAESGREVGVLSPSTSYATLQHYDLGVPISGSKIGVGGGYLVVGGVVGTANDVLLYKLENGIPRLLDLGGFFQKYYFSAPDGYAVPGADYPYMALSDVKVVATGGKTYLMFSGNGIGDVFEIQSGDNIAASMKANSFGTPNPNAKPDQTGPFYGDVLNFKAATTSTTANFGINWDFGNPEVGTGTYASSALGEYVPYQFNNLTTSAKITTPRVVKAVASTDSTITDSVTVNLKVPKARIGVQGSAAPITTSNAAFEAVYGEKLNDASDGAVEGHYSTWTIDGTPVTKLPSDTVDVGLLGAHTVSLDAHYGKYDPASPSGTGYVSSVSAAAYTVRPFIATLRPLASQGTDFIFNADARWTKDTQILPATQWTVTWTLTPPTAGITSNAVSTNTTTGPITIGTIPSFSVPKPIANGSVVTLQISVDAAGVSDPNFTTYTTSMTITTPDPKIILPSTGCTNAGEPCTLTVGSLSGKPVTGWTLAWTILKSGTAIKTGSGTSITFTPADAGSYSAKVDETVFGVYATQPLTIAPVACASPAPAEQIALSADCGTTCKSNQTITFRADFYPYQVQACDTFAWNFGDGSTSTELMPTHAFATSGNYTVKFTLKNNSGTTTVSKTFSIGTTSPPPTTTCTAPTNITITYAGTLGCRPGGAQCQVGETVTFTGRRGTASLQSCDNGIWTIDGTVMQGKSVQYTFRSTGSHTVGLEVSNTSSTTSGTASQTLTIVDAPPVGCGNGPADYQLGITFVGGQSGCYGNSGILCRANEVISFNATAFQYNFQTCDKFAWDFGDGTTSDQQSPTHAYAGTATAYTVKLRVYNTTTPTGATVSVNVPFSNAPALEIPTLTYSGFRSTGSKNTPVTFTVSSNISATGWTWDFGDGSKDTTQATAVGQTSTVTHAYNKVGTFSVSVKARNSKDVATAPTGIALGQIVIDDMPEARYLLPVVTHIGGQGGSAWRTDVQIYNPDSNVDALTMTAQLNGGAAVTLTPKASTYIYEDFAKLFGTGNVSGPVIISTKAQNPPQIWTRTYNATEKGTFGQFIPAIRLDVAGAGGASTEDKYYLTGLRQDPSFRTNVGLVNPNSQNVTVEMFVYNDEHNMIGKVTRVVAPYQLDQFSLAAVLGAQNPPVAIPANRPFTVQMQVPAGQWLVAYGSFIDNTSNDPVYIEAVRESDLESQDFAHTVLPGVGHIGDWRSDVTIFNPDSFPVSFAMQYYDAAGNKIGDPSQLTIKSFEFVQFHDLLKAGVINNAPDGIGVLRIDTTPGFTTRFPLVFARTYNEKAGQGTFGQGISAFATARANVSAGKPALIPAVRNDDKYDAANQPISGYYSNIGLTNVTDAAVTVNVTILSPETGQVVNRYPISLKPFESVIGRIQSDLFGGATRASLKIETDSGSVWAFASVIDAVTKDPEYVPATPVAH